MAIVRINIPKAVFKAAKDVAKSLERQFLQAKPVAAANSPSRQVAAALEVEVEQTAPTTVKARMGIDTGVVMERRNSVEISGRKKITIGRRTFDVRKSFTERPTLAEIIVLFEGGWDSYMPKSAHGNKGFPYVTIWGRNGNQYNWIFEVPGHDEDDFLMDRLREIIRKYGGGADEYI